MSSSGSAAAPAPKDDATLSPPRPEPAAAAGLAPRTDTRPSVEGREMFSPTSAAALALSTLHASAPRPKQRPEDLKGTRLFNQQGASTEGHDPDEEMHSIHRETANVDNENSTTTTTPSDSRYESTSPPVSFVPGMMHYGVPTYPPALYHQQPPLPPAQQYAHWQRGDSSSHVGSTSPWQPTQYYMTAPYSGDPNQGSSPGVMGSSPTNGPPQDPKDPSAHTNTAYLLQHTRSSPNHAPTGATLYPPPPGMIEQFHDKPYARAQSQTHFVTPTPKKAKHGDCASSEEKKKNAAYSRKKKSLGVLAENFLNSYKDLPQGSTIIVDEAAVALGVERRRIYDVVNILEAIQLVTKKHKNTYTWIGLDHLDVCFGRLQQEAIEDYPEDAKKFLGIEPAGSRAPKFPPKGREFKSLAKLSQEFLQVFLVGHGTLSLPEASDKIQGQTSLEELIAMGQGNSQEMDDKALKAAAARGLKTKIRRLYDIANVFLSVGLLQKVDSRDATRRPNFSWAWPTSPMQIYQKHKQRVQPTREPTPSNPTVTPAPSTSSSPTNNFNPNAEAALADKNGQSPNTSNSAVIESV